MPKERARWNTPLNSSDPKIGGLGASNKTYPFFADGCDGSCHLILAGDPTVTIVVYASDDHDPADQNDKWNGTWENVNSKLDTAIVNPAGAGASYLIEFPVYAQHYYIDIAYTAGAATNTARATWVKKTGG